MNNNSPTPSAKLFSWKTATVLFLGAGLIAVGLSVVLQHQTHLVQGILAGNPKPVAVAASPAVGLGSPFVIPTKPVRLIIPAIGVNAAIQSVGLYWNGDGAMSIPTNFTDVAWYNQGPLPGMPGNAVIDGHLDGRNVPEAVFFKLGDLKPGDIVEVVDQSGKTLQFKVTGSKHYAYNATTSDIFSGDLSEARLNLITCAGDWNDSDAGYNQRVVVFTQLVT